MKKLPKPKMNGHRTELQRIARNRGYTLEQIDTYCTGGNPDEGGVATRAHRALSGAAYVRDDYAAKLAELLRLPRGKLTFLLQEARRDYRKQNGFTGGR